MSFKTFPDLQLSYFRCWKASSKQFFFFTSKEPLKRVLRFNWRPRALLMWSHWPNNWTNQSCNEKRGKQSRANENFAVVTKGGWIIWIHPKIFVLSHNFAMQSHHLIKRNKMANNIQISINIVVSVKWLICCHTSWMSSGESCVYFQVKCHFMD